MIRSQGGAASAKSASESNKPNEITVGRKIGSVTQHKKQKEQCEYYAGNERPVVQPFFPTLIYGRRILVLVHLVF